MLNQAKEYEFLGQICQKSFCIQCSLSQFSLCELGFTFSAQLFPSDGWAPQGDGPLLPGPTCSWPGRHDQVRPTPTPKGVKGTQRRPVVLYTCKRNHSLGLLSPKFDGAISESRHATLIILTRGRILVICHGLFLKLDERHYDILELTWELQKLQQGT